MKKLITLSSLSALLPVVSFAQSYPATCPTEAQSIVSAVGGCSTIDKVAYSNVYAKCCVVAASNGIMIYIIAGVAVVVVALVAWMMMKKKKSAMTM